MPAPFSITAAELAACDFRALPPELVSTRHLIYSSPATLAFNSPGAQAEEHKNTDEFMEPLVNSNVDGRIKPGDVVIFFNFRSDRAKELTIALDARVRRPYDQARWISDGRQSHRQL